MATWIAHLRIAENLLRIFDLPEEPFLVGNIGADSGVDDGNGGWMPPKPLTHWFDENGNIAPEAFYEKYTPNSGFNTERDAFLLGYYAHLVADVEWILHIWRPFKANHPDVMQRLQSDSDFVWEIKRDWYGLDFLYLNQNPDNIFQEKFQQIQQVPDYLDYLVPGALTQAVERIKAYYAQKKEFEAALAHDYSYLQQSTMDEWIEATTATVEALYVTRGVPQKMA